MRARRFQDLRSLLKGEPTTTLCRFSVPLLLKPQDEDPAFVQQDGGALLIDAATPIAAVLPRFDLPPMLASGAHYTLAGFCLERLGRVPAAGDRFSAEGWRFEVVGMDGLRVDKVLATRA